ncbi:MAG: hypothetical protein KKF44_06465 [Nanoarchaeota archaeon]|nr:hypothetical protein [Nanoarchaeota archaeon]
MKKRGQITLFIIAGVALVLVFSLYQCNKEKEAKEYVSAKEDVSNLGLQKESLLNFVNTCLKKNLKEAIDIHGISPSKETAIGSYIVANIDDCVDRDLLSSGGIDILEPEGGAKTAAVHISNDAISVVLQWKLEISKKGTSLLVEEFSYDFPTCFEIKLIDKAPKDYKIDESIGFASPDNDLTITIEKNTFVEPATCFDKPLKICLVHEEPGNPVNICKVSYDLQPAGCKFDPPLELHFTYPSPELRSGSSSTGTAGRTDEITIGLNPNPTDTTSTLWYNAMCFTNNLNDEISCSLKKSGYLSCIESNEAELDPDDLDPCLVDQSTHEAIKAERFGKLEVGAGLPSVCGNNIIYWVAEPFFCIPDTGEKIYEWIINNQNIAGKNFEEFANYYGVQNDPNLKQIIDALKNPIARAIYLVPSKKQEIVDKLDDFIDTYVPLDQITYNACTYHGQEFTKQELINIANGDRTLIPANEAGLELCQKLDTNLRNWRPDVVPCKCGDGDDAYYIHSPIRTDDPYLCYIG